MPTFRKPSVESMRRFLEVEATRPFSYSAVGATATTPPAGYVVDHTRIKLGDGERVFQAAMFALWQWEHFRLGWVETWPPETAIQPNEVVAVLARVCGLWWLNSCRIVYVIDESSPIRKFGFAYGTLPGHTESGEERFMVEWDQSENSVWYDIVAFSKSNHYLARLAYPITRRIQKKFGRDSAASMLKAVRSVEVSSVRPAS